MASAAYTAALDSVRSEGSGMPHDRRLRLLAEHIGIAHAKTATLLALTAVLAQAANPEQFRRDQDAWDKYGVSRSSFQSMKKKLRPIMTGADQSALPGETTSHACPLPTATQNDDDPLPEVALRAELQCLVDACNASLPPAEEPAALETDGIVDAALLPDDEPVLASVSPSADVVKALALLGVDAPVCRPLDAVPLPTGARVGNASTASGSPEDEPALASDPPSADVEPLAALDVDAFICGMFGSLDTVPSPTGASDVIVSVASHSPDDEPASASDSPAAAAAPCVRPDCPCVSYDGRAGEYCCKTCRGGKPCTRQQSGEPVHPLPTQPPRQRQLAPAAIEVFARCARTCCQCVASFDGKPDSYCCITCRDGTPCDKNYHFKPTRRSRKGQCVGQCVGRLSDERW